jgi:transketolase
MKYSNYEDLLKNLAIADERIVVMTAENRALIRNLPQVLEGRFIDTGITEQCMIGAAAGLALRGRIPIVHALATFLTLRAFEFIRTDVGIPGLPVKLTGAIAGFLSDGNGPTHQALEDIGLMRSIPGMQVFSPADEQDMLIALPEIWNSSHPSYLRAIPRPASYSHDTEFKIGKAEVISLGSDVTFLVYGLLFEETLKAKYILEKQGLSVGLINMRSLKPVDEEILLDVQKHSELIVTVEDHFLTGGLYSILAEVYLNNQVTANVLPLAMNERWFKPALLPQVLEYEGFTGQQIADKVYDKLSHNKTPNTYEYV